MTIEVNTSGKKRDCNEWYLSFEILERAYFYGIPITFGSDAHTPDRVGDEQEKVKMQLKEIGFKQWALFQQRKRHMVDL